MNRTAISCERVILISRKRNSGLFRKMSASAHNCSASSTQRKYNEQQKDIPVLELSMYGGEYHFQYYSGTNVLSEISENEAQFKIEGDHLYRSRY